MFLLGSLLIPSWRHNVTHNGVWNIHRLILHQNNVKRVNVGLSSFFHLRDEADRPWTSNVWHYACSSKNPVIIYDLVIEKPNSQDVLGLGYPISHGQISQRVSQQQHVGSTLQLSEASCMRQSTFPLVVGVNELAFKGLQDALIKKENTENPSCTHPHDAFWMYSPFWHYYLL